MTDAIPFPDPLPLSRHEKKVAEELKAYSTILSKNQHPVDKAKPAYVLQYYCEEKNTLLGFVVTDNWELVLTMLRMCQEKDPRTVH